MYALRSVRDQLEGFEPLSVCATCLPNPSPLSPKNFHFFKSAKQDPILKHEEAWPDIWRVKKDEMEEAAVGQETESQSEKRSTQRVALAAHGQNQSEQIEMCFRQESLGSPMCV